MNFIKTHRTSILLIIIVILGLTAGYFYKKSTTNEAAISAREVKNLTNEIGKLVMLPTDETPTVATVSDPEALKDQPFFANALKDDKVLIYSNAKKAILYRPSIERVVNIAPLNLGEADPQKAANPAPVESQTSTTPTKKQ